MTDRGRGCVVCLSSRQQHKGHNMTSKRIPLRGKHKHSEAVAGCRCVECREAFTPTEHATARREEAERKQALAEAAALLVLRRMREAQRDAARVRRLTNKQRRKGAVPPTEGTRLARRRTTVINDGEVVASFDTYTVPSK